MNFAEELNIRKNAKVIKFAEEFLENIKPTLIDSAEKGYSAFKYEIDTIKTTEKEKLQLYSNPLFVDKLNQNLEGVTVKYEKVYHENIFFKGYGNYSHHLLVRW